MKQAISLLWRKNKLLLIAFTLTLSVTLYFGIRAGLHALYWNDPAHIDQPIAGWMSPRYVSLSWDLPRGTLVEALGLTERPPSDGKPPSLRVIADSRGIPLETLIAEVEQAIAAHRNAEGKTTP